MEVRASAIARTVRFEGNVPHFYLDTKGEVTIGVGQMIPDAASALPLQLTVDGKPATDEQKKACWTTIEAKAPGQPAASYAKHTKCRISEKASLALLKDRLKLAATDLKKRFADLDSYPDEAQDALLDMMFNIGITRLKEASWPSLFKAVTAADWKQAGAQSNRKDVSAERNAEIKRLFEAAPKPDLRVLPMSNASRISSTA